MKLERWALVHIEDEHGEWIVENIVEFQGRQVVLCFQKDTHKTRAVVKSKVSLVHPKKA